MKIFGLVVILVFLTILGILIPLPTLLLDLLLVIEISLILSSIFIMKNKNIRTLIKYIIFIGQYSLCMCISSLRLILTYGLYSDSKIINGLMPFKEGESLFYQVFYKYYIGIYIIIILLITISTLINIIRCKQELKSITFENKIVNKNNGEIFCVNDPSIREKIIEGYKNIIKINFIMLIYIFVNIIYPRIFKG
jgi:hypothetical protein